MTRVRDFDRTRLLLITVAGQLFATQGYDRISVDRIIKEAGVSKGAFYHHFSSKEEILDAVTEAMVADAMAEIREAVADASASATVRLNRFLNASKVFRLAHFGLLREVGAVLLRDENAPMLRKIQSVSGSLSAPLLTDIIQQGIDEGVFDPPDAGDTASLILHLSWAMLPDQLRVLLESGTPTEVFSAIQHRADFILEMVERVLGAQKGSIERLNFLEALGSVDLEVGTHSIAKAGAE